MGIRVDPFYATGQYLLDYLQNGYKYFEIWSHSSSPWSHAINNTAPGPRPEFNSFTEAKELIGSGACINIVSSCSCANILEAQDGCLAERYIHCPLGMVSTGITRPFINYIYKDPFFEDNDENGISDN